MEDIILIGGGGHCKSIIDTIKMAHSYNIVGIIDVENNIGKYINGIRVIDSDKNLWKYKSYGIKNAFISIGSVGNTSLRRKLCYLAKKTEFIFPIIIDNSAIVSEDVQVGEGTFIGKRVLVNTGSVVGSNCILNSGAIIEHDCYLEDFVHISPGSVLCGGVKVGSDSHIGSNSTIIQYRTIGSNVMIGAGSIVTKDIKSNVKALGNPCKIIQEY